MQSTDRAEFDVQMANLCAGFNVPMGERANAYWLGLSKMDLVTFARVVLECLGPDGPEKFPTVSRCWAISKKMRVARYAAPVIPEVQWQGDHWDIEANHHLLNYLRKHPKKYAPDTTYGPVRYGDLVRNEAIPGPLTKAYSAILVRWKKTWAEDMRAEPNPTPEIKQSAWQDCMERADQQIQARSQQAAA